LDLREVPLGRRARAPRVRCTAPPYAARCLERQ
jgi:hypothetical protein